MRSIVISALFDALPPLGYGCLRFNFRGVEGSGGSHTDGRDEPSTSSRPSPGSRPRSPSAPIVLVAWSFGADMALQVTDPRVAGWVGDRAAAAIPIHVPGRAAMRGRSI